MALEAKRLLVHSRLPIQAIADALNFDEATNFVKLPAAKRARRRPSFEAGSADGPHDSGAEEATPSMK